MTDNGVENTGLLQVLADTGLVDRDNLPEELCNTPLATISSEKLTQILIKVGTVTNGEAVEAMRIWHGLNAQSIPERTDAQLALCELSMLVLQRHRKAEERVAEATNRHVRRISNHFTSVSESGLLALKKSS